MKESVTTKENKIRREAPRRGFAVLLLLSIIPLCFLSMALYYQLYRPYSAVYLTSGDVYYGKLSRFPRMTLHDPWFMQRGSDGSFSLLRFSDAFWKPANMMQLSRDKVIFVTRFQPDSPVIAAMEGRAPQGIAPINQDVNNNPEVKSNSPVSNSAPIIDSKTTETTAVKKTSN